MPQGHSISRDFRSPFLIRFLQPINELQVNCVGLVSLQELIARHTCFIHANILNDFLLSPDGFHIGAHPCDEFIHEGWNQF